MREAVWQCAQAELLRLIPATWVPESRLTPIGKHAVGSKKQWGKAVWGAGAQEQIGATGTRLLRLKNTHVFRHQFGCVWYIQARPASAGDTLLPADQYTQYGGASQLDRRQEGLVDQTRTAIGKLAAVQDLREFVRLRAATQAMAPSQPTAADAMLSTAALATQNTTGARHSARAAEITKSDVSAVMEDGPSAFHSLPQPRKDAALQGLVNVATEGISVATELERIRDGASALDVIKLFTPEASQRLIFGSKGAPAQMRSASFGPAYESFEDMGKGMQSRLTTAMSTVAIKISETLFLQDAPALLHAMVKQPHFRDFALPQSLIDDSNGYAEFARNKAVLAVVSAVSKMTPYDPERTQLLSLLSDYPRTWIDRLCKIDRLCEQKDRSESEPELNGASPQAQQQHQASIPATVVSRWAMAKARVHDMQHMQPMPLMQLMLWIPRNQHWRQVRVCITL